MLQLLPGIKTMIRNGLSRPARGPPVRLQKKAEKYDRGGPEARRLRRHGRALPHRRRPARAGRRRAGAGAAGGSTKIGRVQKSPKDLVREFHEAFNLDVRSTPTQVSPVLAAHRQDLLAEETAEVGEASLDGDICHIANELADVVYTAYGTALVYGIDLDAVIAEVHRANMSKLGPDGRPVLRADGKVMKGEHYQAPDVASVLFPHGSPGIIDVT